MKGIYLCSNIARHHNYDIDYLDIDSSFNCDFTCDFLDFDFSNYDFVICSPPCNYWSKLNHYYKTSLFANQTKSLLFSALIKCKKNNKPFIIENVINRKRFEREGIYALCDLLNIVVIEIGRHTYFCDTFYNLNCEQHKDFCNFGVRCNDDGYNQGGSNVFNVIEMFLKEVLSNSNAF